MPSNRSARRRLRCGLHGDSSFRSETSKMVTPKSCAHPVRLTFRQILTVLLATAWILSWQNAALAQLIRAELNGGFERTSSITMSVDEMLGSQKTREEGTPILGPGYPDLWIAEVQFKPVRFVRMNVTDPKTGETRLELVWYMIYRVIPRDYTELAGGGESRERLLSKLRDQQVHPDNPIDAVVGAPLLLPRFVLRTDDTDKPQYYADEVSPQIQQSIFNREYRERAAGLKLRNSVQAIVEVQEPVSVNDPDQLSKAVYGVAVWRNVDPETDYCTVTMTGFSNAYRIHQVDGQTVVEHKVIEQRFGRPGDKYKQDEAEFRLIDDARLERNGTVVVQGGSSNARFPVDQPAPAFVATLRQELQTKLAAGQDPVLHWPAWHYQPRNASISVPAFDSILRNARSAKAAAAVGQ